jgi:hypothetical protein
MARISFLFLIISNSCFSQIKSKEVRMLVDTTVNLYAFVGQKISLVEYDPNKDYSNPKGFEIDSTSGDTIIRRSYIMDYAFDAKYRVFQGVFNDLKTDTVQFKAFDHYGRPGFEKYSTVLLYISKSEKGNFYFHQKYQFDPVFKGKNGEWVGKNGESLEQLFKEKKQTVFKERGIF